MALCFGAHAAWVGTRFVASVEGGAPKNHKEAVVKAGFHDTLRTVIYTGRPMRVLKTPFNEEFNSRHEEIDEFLKKGIIPMQHFVDESEEKIKKGEMKMPTPTEMAAYRPLLMGSCAGSIHDILPAKQIIDDMVRVAIEVIREINGKIGKAKL